MSLICYPYDFEYKVKNGKVYVYLYAKAEDHQHLCVVHEHYPFFYVKVPEKNKEQLLEKITKATVTDNQTTAHVRSITEVTREFIGKQHQFWQVYVSYPKAVPLFAKEFQQWGLECFEKDILFVHRYLRDMNIIPMQKITVSGRLIDSEILDEPQTATKFFLADNITPGEGTTKWKILAVDIETYAEKKEIDPEKNPILMIGLSGIDEHNTEFQKVITWKNFQHDYPYIEHVVDEKAMLEHFQKLLREYNPEILTGYFSDGFDLPYLKTRCLKYNLALDFQVFSKSGFRSGEVKVKSILHLDILKFVKQIFGLNLKTDSFKLDAVAQELLGHGKHKVNLDNLAGIWDYQPEKLAQYCAYNLHDALLTRKLCEKLLSDILEFTTTVGLPPFDVTRMRFSKLVENYILKRAMEFNVVAPNKAEGAEMEDRMEESIEGAFVYQPTPGLYQDIVVFDYRSLYPTIITAHNLGPEAFRCSCCKEKQHVPGKEEYWFCQREKKFIPKVLDDLITRRTVVKKQLKEEKKKGANVSMLEARTYALKILANSFYGYLGFFGARWYCLECAASTTAYARYYIKKTIKKAEENGFKAIYADTDSCFLLLNQKPQAEAMKFMDEVNVDLPGQMELEFEGYFPRGIFVAIKGTDVGAKKKYALIRSDGTLKITGFETVRRNWSSLAKEVQEKVLRLVLEGKVDEALQYVKEIVTELHNGKIEISKLIIKTQITRELHQYTSLGPHVIVAKRMEERGERVTPGMVVEYVIAAGTGQVRDRAALVADVKRGGYDAEYYLNHQVIPAVIGILTVFGYTEEDILGKGKQTGLGKWF